MGCLYQIESPSGKKYLGITMRPLKERWRVHRANVNRSKGYLQNAIKKYGADKFKVTELVIANDFEYLKDLESKAIVAFDTKAPRGYNMTDGGDGVIGVVITPEGRARRQAAQRASFADPERRRIHKEAQQNPELRKWRSDQQKNISAETRAKISLAMKSLWNNEEFAEKMRVRWRKPKKQDGLTKSQRYRLKDLDAYRKKKAAYARTPQERTKRTAYNRKWREANREAYNASCRERKRQQKLKVIA